MDSILSVISRWTLRPRPRSEELTATTPVPTRKPAISLVVVVFNMAREAPRTLLSLSPAYQQHIDSDDYEIIVVDNGSDVPLDPQMIADLQGNFKVIRLDPASPSPARALNVGMAAASGDVIGLMIDGARMVTPGLIHYARRGAYLQEKALVVSLGFYLGYGFQGWNGVHGYGPEREDRLLAKIEWPSDGYRLFEISTMDESSIDGWFQPIAESNAMFARRDLWQALGPIEERFDEPGGGLLNLYTYERMLQIADGHQVVLLGEGTFHQFHGGVSTNEVPEKQARKMALWTAQFERIAGHRFTWQQPKTRSYVGSLHPSATSRLVRSATNPAGHDLAFHILGKDFERATWSRAVHREASQQPIGEIAERGRAYMREDRIEEAFGLARFLRERVAEPTGLDYVLGLISGSVRVTDEALQRRAGYHVALAEAHEAFGEVDAAANRYRSALEADPDCPQAHLGLARLRMSGASCLEHLARIYAWAAPESVVQIGVSSGDALALLLPPTIAIAVDPIPASYASLRTQTHIFAETSDAFFERKRVAHVVGERPLSIGFINGSRSFQQALRDFIGLEAVCGPKSLIIFSHTLALDEANPSGGRANSVQSGDVWKTIVGLKRFRSDLEIFTIPTAPAGLSIVSNLNPHSRSLTDGYDEIVAEMTQVSLRSTRPDLYAILGVVSNDWSQIGARLNAVRAFAVE